MKPARLIFLHSASEMGGVEFSTLYLAQRLDPARWQPLVVVPREGEFSHQCQDLGFPVEVVPLPRLISTSLRYSTRKDRRIPNPFAWLLDPWILLVTASRLASFIEARSAALVVTKGTHAHICGGLACRWRQTPCLWHLQDLISSRYAGLYTQIFGLTASRLADLVVADGSPIIEQLPPAIQSHARVVLNGIDTAIFHPDRDGSAIRNELGIDPAAIVIGHAARLTPWKGQRHLLDAFSSIAGAYPQAHLLLVGSALFDSDRYALSLRQSASEMRLEGRVTFAGFRRDLPDVLPAMDIFVYPSLEKDTSPLSLLSAMASGLPVIAYDIPGVREVIGDAGNLVLMGDAERLSEAIQSLMDDPDRRQQMGQTARRRAESTFSLEAHTQAMQNAFEAAIQHAHPVRS
jgi:glycosyltransferase involved in cell wall biosynthesis